MQIPARVPGLKLLTIGWVAYGVIWIAPEGVLWQAVLLGGLTTAVLLAYLVQKVAGGRVVAVGWWLGGTAVTGALFGVLTGLLTLFFMALKTGLHAHGPEFTPAEINWVLAQMPLWTAVGLLTGAGLGLVVLGAVDKQ
ncbi:MAG: hypothetical protein HND44_05050 [Chloroflexi bacterium]|nr:hypothetical protein [Ardenticatenaceae bacterium]MBL1127862.1 hypothetical protein [Chloroflexota bacterium]NOG33931.1 hypothetical protein [Chloroflexota bacterium]GIK55614.1 MAG: hypothetical protein BroJett015_12770 [Chloroflexota bacterium]